MEYTNTVSFMVRGDYALFTDPITKIGGEKFTYPIPTYEALKGVIHSIYWKPTIIWYIDRVRVMNEIKTMSKGVRAVYPVSGRAAMPHYYTYLYDCEYQVQAHFEWNTNRPELACDRNEGKHYEIAKRMIKKGGRRDVFLGTRECQAEVEPCVFGKGKGFYDLDDTKKTFGLMYHGITYADEAYSPETKGRMTTRFWFPEMNHGIIEFPRPEEIPVEMCKFLHEMDIKPFEPDVNMTGVIKEAV